MCSADRSLLLADEPLGQRLAERQQDQRGQRRDLDRQSDRLEVVGGEEHLRGRNRRNGSGP